MAPEKLVPDLGGKDHSKKTGSIPGVDLEVEDHRTGTLPGTRLSFSLKKIIMVEIPYVCLVFKNVVSFQHLN